MLKRRLLAFQQYFSYTCSTCKDFLYECLKFYVWCVLCATIIIYMYYLVSRKEILTLTFSGGETHRPCSLCLKERVFLSTVFLAQIGTLGSQILQHGFLGSGLVWWVSCEINQRLSKLFYHIIHKVKGNMFSKLRNYNILTEIVQNRFD